jgi:DNA-binding transcriptional regulator YhcF (GntR family)
MLYEIATGNLKPGEGLPSVRKAEDELGASRLTVLKAYRRLTDMGLVRSRPRSGFVVARGAEYDRLTRDRYLMEGLYEDLSKAIREREGLSVLGTLRYLTRLAEQEYLRLPESAFVEATDIQAGAYADEIRRRLQVPVAALTLDGLGPDFRGLPRSVRAVLTTAPLSRKLAPLTSKGLRVETVPVQISAGTLDRLNAGVREAWLLDSDDVEITRILDDLEDASLAVSLRPKVVSDVEGEVHRILDNRVVDPRSIVLMAPHLWRRLHPALREHSRVAPLTFQIAEEAWTRLADAIGMPFPSPVGL